tara:strand:- start:10 stop:159 length:150 start_codon:yes stop_codon:yes gene_type:complete
MIQDGIGSFGTDNRNQFFSRGTPDVSHTTKLGQQRSTSNRTNTWYILEF